MNDNIDILKELAAPFKALENVMSGVAKNFAAATDTMKSAAREMATMGRTIKSAFDGLKHTAMSAKENGGGGNGLFGLAALFGTGAVAKITHNRNLAAANLNTALKNFDMMNDLLSKGGSINGNPVTVNDVAGASKGLMDAQTKFDKANQPFLWLKDPIGQTKQGFIALKDNLTHLSKSVPSAVFKTVGSLGLLVAVVAAAAIAFKVMSSAAKDYVAMMRENMTGLVHSGGSIGQLGQLHSISAMFGMSGGQFGIKARQFGDLLTNGGIPAGIAAQMGIKPYGGLGGDQNYLNKFLTAIQNVVNDPDFDRASKKARYLGLEEFMWLRDADAKHKSMVFNAAGENMSPADRRASANAQAVMFKLQKELNEAWLDFGRRVLPIVISGLKALTAVMVFFIDGLNVALGALVGGAVGALIGFFIGGPIGAIKGGFAGTVIGATAGLAYDGVSAMGHGDKDAAIGANTQAIKANTDAVIQNTMMQNGTYGGGSRFNRNVIPAGWGPMQINDSARGTAIALGALQL